MYISTPALIGRHHLIVGIAGQLTDAFPIGNEKTVKAQFVLQHIGQQILVAVHLGAVPTTERRHDAQRARLDSGFVGRQITASRSVASSTRVSP